MKTEDLKALGLTDEQIAGIFKINGKSESKSKEDIEKITAERDALADKLKTTEEVLKGFAGVDVKELEGKISSLQADLKAKDDDYNAKIADLTFNSLLDNLINASGAKNAKATRILYINPTLYRAIMDMDTTKSKAVLDSFEKIVKVPQSRFNTGVKLNDGTSVGETTGGYVR